jgi:serine phosphatase RsbU (regulator of sigma subunit)/integral membrane sensor domain MASE1
VRAARGTPRSWIAGDRRVYALAVLLLAGAYYGAAKLGLSLAFMTPSVTAIWPPTGIALAAVILLGYRIWPGVALGAFLANAWTGVPLYTTLGITVGNTLEAIVGAYLLARLADFRPSLNRVRDVLALVVFAGILSTMVSATIGTTSVLIGNEISGSQFGSTWRTWWLGDMGGDLVVATALLVAVTHWPYRDLPGRPLEAVGLGALVAATAAFVFTTETPLTFLIVTPLVLVALRFLQPGSVLASLILAAIAVPLTENGHGPFAGSSPDDRLLLAQAVIGVSSVTTLILAGVISERRRVEHTLEGIAATLQESLLPGEVPRIPGVETAIYYRPAGERQLVGGDFYDVFELDEGSWALVVGDVVGKGASAAATTALARYTLRAAAVHERRPSRLLAELNDAILRQTPGQSCTVAYARLETNPVAGARLTLASGGHPPWLVLRADGEVDVIETHSLVLGIEEDPALEDRELDLGPGDALIVYTDGLTDAFAPRRIVRVDDVAAVLQTAAGRSAAEITERVTSTILSDEWGNPRDDILVLVARVPASGRALRGTGWSPAPRRAS